MLEVIAAPSTTPAASTSHVVALPAPIVAGNLLRAYVAYNNGTGAGAWTWPAGWTPLSGGASDNNGSNHGLAYAWKIAEAGDVGLASITVESAVACKSAHQAAAISLPYPGQAPAIGVAAGGSATQPDPPSLTSGWGAELTLWEAVIAYDLSSDATIVVSVYPTDYTDGANPVVATTDGVGLGVARRLLAAASENPGPFTITASEQVVRNTLAFRGLARRPRAAILVAA